MVKMIRCKLKLIFQTASEIFHCCAISFESIESIFEKDSEIWKELEKKKKMGQFSAS
jgi:hypothetical protein